MNKNQQFLFPTQEIDNHLAFNHKQLKIKLPKNKDQFVAQLISKGLFSNNEDLNQYQIPTSIQQIKNNSDSPTRRRKAKQQKQIRNKLKNQKQITNQYNNQPKQSCQTVYNQSNKQFQQKHQKNKINLQVQQYLLVRNQIKNMHIFFQEDEQQIQPQNIKQQIKQAQLNTKQQNNQNQNIQIKRGSINHLFVNQQQQNQQEHYYPGSQYFTYSQEKQVFKKQIFSSVKNHNTLQLQLIRDKGSIFSFWPQFHLHFSVNNQHIMSAKKTSSKPTSTFIISTNRYDFSQNSSNYLGKMKSNVFGDVLNIFGPGLNPSNAKSQNKIPRQLLATIVYQSNGAQANRPRSFRLYVKKPHVRYYTMPHVKMYEQQISLYSLSLYPQNKDKISLYYNRVPQWNQQLKLYSLNFKGRAQEPSIKNFILQEQKNGQDLVLFGKLSEQKFSIDISYPISPFIGFALVLSTFDTRMLLQ